MSKLGPTKQASIAVLIFSLIYSAILIFQQQVVRGSIHPVHLKFLTSSIALVLIASYIFFNRKKYQIPKKPHSLYALLNGLSNSVVGDILILFGLQQSSAINLSIIISLTGITTYLFATRLAGEKQTTIKFLAICLSIIGAYMVVKQPEGIYQISRGDIFFILAAIAYGFGNTMNQKALAGIPIAIVTSIRIAISALIFGLITLLFIPLTQITIWPFIVTNGLAAVIGIGIVNFVIKKAGASFFAIGVNLVPVITVILSVIILSQLPTPNQILGGIIVIISIIIFERAKLANGYKNIVASFLNHRG